MLTGYVLFSQNIYIK